MESKDNQGNVKGQLDELKRAFEHVKVKLHLAGMDVREAWKAWEPRFEELENKLVAAGREVTRDVASAFDQLGGALKKLGAEIEKRTKGESKSE